jgi:hypothetical protein
MAHLRPRLRSREDISLSSTSAFADSTVILFRCCAIAVAIFLTGTTEVGGVDLSESQGTYTPNPKAILIPARGLGFTGYADSNSPGVWAEVRGRSILHVLTSIDGAPSRSLGSDLTALGPPRDVRIEPWPSGGNWLEAVIADDDGVWYGYYHNERHSQFCGEEQQRMAPRIGAARSFDNGRTWEDLGIVLEAPPETDECDSPNTYFVGGVGDFSAILDRDKLDLYFFYSQYVGWTPSQGVAIARLPWADRNEPVGKITIYADGGWASPTSDDSMVDESAPARWSYPHAVPVFPARVSWHNPEGSVDAYWGPSVHWNTHLRQYVMLLNRAKDSQWTQQGIYISYAKTLDDPKAWSAPRKLISGGRWYPQVFGLETGTGTDKTAGEVARFFMSGYSEYLIQFLR